MRQKSFETALKELETVLEKLENGDLSLEESLKYYEKGIGLYAGCAKELEQARLKLTQLQKEDQPDESNE